jgi:hypothetical protein
MATHPRLRTRLVAVSGATALLLAAGTVPAWAADPMPGSANDTVMSTGQAILVFVGIPILVAAVIWLLVLAPGWTRGGRASSADAWTADPLVLGSEPAADAPAALEADTTTDAAGGTSASW